MMKSLRNLKINIFQIEMKINDLWRMRDVLSDLEHDCAGSGKARGCAIIDALSAETSIESGMEKQVKNRKKDAS